MQIQIKTPKYFSFKECLWYLDRGFDECLYTIKNQKVYRAVCFEGKKSILEVEGGVNGLNIRVAGPPVSEAKLFAYISNWFDLDRDLAGFYIMAQKEPLLKDLVVRYVGLRLVAIEDLFEALCWTIIGQQINLAFAYKLKRALVENYGSFLPHDDLRLYIFPTPEELCHVRHEDLLALQFSRQKASYILSLAETFRQKAMVKEDLQRATMDEAIAELSSLYGIGPWAANYVAMRCLRFANAFPMGDAGLQNAIRDQLGLVAKPTVDQLKQLSEAWSGWQSYATLFLWRSLSDKG